MAMDQNQNQSIDPLALIELAIYAKINELLELMPVNLNVDVGSKAIENLASALATLKQKQTDLTPDQKFQLELLKFQHQVQMDQTRLQLEAAKAQHDLRIKQAESAIRRRGEQQKQELKVLETKHKIAQDAATQAVKRETMRQAAAAKAEAQREPKPSQSNNSKSSS